MNYITKGMTPLGDPCLRIDPLALSQEEVKAMLLYLQAFAETGTLEPSPLQGVDEAKLELDKVKKAASYYRRQCDQYVDQVANLEELIKDWRRVYQSPTVAASELNDLQKRTNQLLKEE